jgi:hypothetical protein
MKLDPVARGFILLRPSVGEKGRIFGFYEILEFDRKR